MEAKNDLGMMESEHLLFDPVDMGNYVVLLKT